MTAQVATSAHSNPLDLHGADRLDDVSRPTKHDDAWRYAPHDLLARLLFGSTTATAQQAPAVAVNRIPQLDGPRIVIVNGVIDVDQSQIAALPDGLRISTFAGSATEPTDPADDVDSGFAADAFLIAIERFGSGGVAIEVTDGHHLDVPIHLVDLVAPNQTRNTPSRSAVVRLGEKSSATIVETRIGTGPVFGGLNTRTSITLESNAALEHILLQNLPETQIHLGRVEVSQHAGSTLRAHSFNLGASYGRVAYEVHLLGAGGQADLSGLYFGTGAQTLDQQITVVHSARDCTSRQSYRGVLDDESTGVFNGGIDVRPGADGTDAQQSNDNLLLSDRAEANTQPRLEILADDVACKHGATVGQLDDSALYYLRTRGITANDARRLLIDAFASQAVDNIDSDAVRAWIRARIGASHA